MRRNTQKKEDITFSIIVCTFNSEKSIGKCLDSLTSINFSTDKFEIIVVDDGSKDKTIDIIKKYPVKLIVHKKNKGVAAARNTGLRYAKNKIYVNFDDDCYVDKNWLKNLEKAYKEFNVTEIAGISGFIKLNKQGNVLEEYMQETGYGNPSPAHYVRNSNIFSRFFSYLKNMFFPSIETPKEIFTVGEIWGANCSFPVKVLKEVNGWSEDLSGVEDTDLCNRIKNRFPNNVFICTKNAVLYHDHQLSFKELFFKPFKRGKVILRFYRNINKVPPIFPFPVAIIILLFLTLIIRPLLFVSLLILLPQIFYSWWIIKAFKKKNLDFLLFPYIQFLYELFTVLGLIGGSLKKIRFSNRFNVKAKLSITSIKKSIVDFKFSNGQLVLLAIALFGVFVNIFVLIDFQVYCIRAVSSVLYLLILPGLLISWVGNIRYKSFWEFFVYTLGISITIIMFLGLGFSYILPLAALAIHSSFTKPLTLLPVLTSLNIIYTILGLWIFFKQSTFPLEIKVPDINWKKIVIFFFVPMIFPLLSIMGAVSLNNGGSSISTLLMIAAITCYIGLLIPLRNKLEEMYPWILFMIGLSLLFMTSLRGWYITGHDINLEYYVFQLTKIKGIWNIKNFQDPYNACLSITILPTIISLFTNITDAYIYKVIYQVLFATSIITTFLFIKKFLNSFLAFLGTFVIVSLPTFMTDMPMLNRQEIALLFFALLLYTLFTKHFSKGLRFSLFVFFSLGMLVSHYSTTYLAVLLFVGAYCMHLPLRLLTLHMKTKNVLQKMYRKLGIIDTKPKLHIGMVIILLITTVVWNVNITNTSTQIVTTLQRVTTIIDHSKKASTSPYVIKGNKNPSLDTILQIYVNVSTKIMHTANDDSAFLSKSIYSQYKVSIAKEELEQRTTLGNYLLGMHLNPFVINDFLKQLYAKIVQLFIIVGFFAIFFLRKHINNLEKEYYILTVTFFIILITQILLPSGSIDYGLLRLFQQGMILFSVPLILGGLGILSIFDSIHRSIKIYVLTFILLFFFLYLSGFIPEVTGGYYAQLNTSNKGGFYYDAYYTHSTDIASMQWLASFRDKKTPVQSDWFALNKIHAYEGFYSFDALIPSSIRINSYVYLSTFNVEDKKIIEYVNNVPLYYTYNFDLLDKNKNLVYNNGKSKIYR